MFFTLVFLSPPPPLLRYEIMLSCWTESVPQRPTFATLQKQLDHMLAAEGSNPYIDFSINPNSLCYQVADEMEPSANATTTATATGDAAVEGHLLVARNAGRSTSSLSRTSSADISRASSKKSLQQGNSPVSSVGSDLALKSGRASPTGFPEKPHGLSAEESGDGGIQRPRSMMLLRGQSPSRKEDEDRCGKKTVSYVIKVNLQKWPTCCFFHASKVQN